MKARRVALAILCLSTVAGCGVTTVRSVRADTADPPEGVLYHLPRNLVRFTLDTRSEPPTAQLHVLAPVPDESLAFVAQIRHGAFSNDTVDFQLTETGLLERVEIKSDGQAGEIIVDLSEASVHVAKLAARGISVPVPVASLATAEEVVSVVFDPAERPDLALDARVGRGPVKSLGLRVTPSRSKRDPSAGAVYAGIVHRTPVPYEIELMQGEKVLVRLTVVLPNGGPIAAVPLEGGLFAEAHSTLTFRDGSLVQVQITEPSEIAGFVGILPETLENVASIPAEVIKDATSLKTEELKLLEKEKELVNARKELLKAQKELEEERNRKPDGGDGDGTEVSPHGSGTPREGAGARPE